MRKCIFSLVLFLLLSPSFLLSSDIYILTTQDRWHQFNGYLDDMKITIKSDAHYARIDLDFYVNVDSINLYRQYYSSRLPTYRDQSLEAQMNFYMPKESFFYDSYLWLNSSTIIRAAHMGNREANRVYDSIVNRRIDPSILQKTWNNIYSLKVFPISTTFRRRVKISYAIPFKLDDSGMEYLSLPTEIISMVKPSDKLRLIVKNNSDLSFNRTIFPLSGKLLSSNNGETLIEIEVAKFKPGEESYLEFQRTNPKIVSFFHQKTNTDDGFYSLRVNTRLLPEFEKNTKVFEINIPMNGEGFTYSSFNNSEGRLLSDQEYLEQGLTFGDIDYSSPIEVSYKGSSKVKVYTESISEDTNTHFLYQYWTHAFCNQYDDQEAIDLSLEYRVLSSQTAFLALEDGDTVSHTSDNSMTGGGAVTSSISNSSLDEGIQIYPNPIVDIFSVSSEEDIYRIRILDLTGKLIFEKNYKKGLRTIELNAAELQLIHGIYIAVIETKNQTITKRIMKD